MNFSLRTHKEDEDCAAASKKELRSVIKTFENAAIELRAAIEVAAISATTVPLISPPGAAVVECGTQISETLSMRNN
jgi:hypothetical protein